MAKDDCGPCGGTGIVLVEGDGRQGERWKSKEAVTCPHCNGSGKK